jgi:hypothetical protein
VGIEYPDNTKPHSKISPIFKEMEKPRNLQKPP